MGGSFFALTARCFAASIKDLAQRSAIHSTVCSDGDYPGPGFAYIPFIRNFDIHSLANNLKDHPSTGVFDDMHHTFASVNAGREPACGFS